MSTNIDIINAIDTIEAIELILSNNKVYEQKRLHCCNKLQKQKKKEATECL